jgi:medium-chain acyl-[acyl-carrier-protein] hydrolase
MMVFTPLRLGGIIGRRVVADGRSGNLDQIADLPHGFSVTDHTAHNSTGYPLPSSREGAMEPMPVWEQAFDVRANEIDAHGRLSVPALCSWLQEAAGRHAHSLNWAVNDLVPRGLTWVLSRLHLRISARPEWTESAIVATWPSGMKRLYALREFRVTDNTGLLVADATSGWLLIDAARRRPLRPPEEIAALARRAPGRVLDDPFGKLPSPAGATAVDEPVARFSDLDINHHVNNVSLIRWVIDGMPAREQQVRYPSELEIEFRAEVAWDDAVEVRVQPEAAEGDVYLHSLVRREDGHEVVRARSVWQAV